MKDITAEIVIRPYQQEDSPLLEELHQSVMKHNPNAVFWWVGDEDNWPNVYCAYQEGVMIAKGQVGIVNVVPPGRSPASKHSIYVNVKTVPDRAADHELLGQLYKQLYARALQLKDTLSTEYGTLLCFGNDRSEEANNAFFIQEGYRHLSTLYCMQHNLSEPIPVIELAQGFEYASWAMATDLEEEEYLEADSEIWPETPLGLTRLHEYKRRPNWKALTIRHDGKLAASLMVCQVDDTAEIEEVFVREPWRKRGLARFLLAQGLTYIQSLGLSKAGLMVLTDNDSALSLYESIGFLRASEEIRYCIDL
ncbi:acetyltransferase (GNAT) family protein [Paenibacillus cellulosilyticus]|uniref:Acetyltransferase (GNAT) family protein n=1 Tax=Paenibacillus cellulosilyticus TaxID=375489 RepID=A0A2V2YYZ7_9BACL|nr:GNAT family N-acetyltransferase [Paenibacillus cellulosilyticus]PWV98542.1 acetyltransferase (GNAT) family protein [Paenibacillus cellulosilyticus]QKS44148.1 GNAT family N-acetyltransferase [Paenibacillus cellulosilyticus]